MKIDDKIIRSLTIEADLAFVEWARSRDYAPMKRIHAVLSTLKYPEQNAAFYLGVIDGIRGTAYLGLSSGSDRSTVGKDWQADLRWHLWQGWQKYNYWYTRGLNEANMLCLMSQTKAEWSDG